jgi:hypothetical protein
MSKVGSLGFVIAGLSLLAILLPVLAFFLAPAAMSALAGVGCLVFLTALAVAGYLLMQLRSIAQELEQKQKS